MLNAPDDQMSRRKEANRAEAIVRGIGALVLLVVLAIMLKVLPHLLKGKSSQEMMETMMHMIIGFAVLAGVVGILGLVVWLKVLKGKKTDGSLREK